MIDNKHRLDLALQLLINYLMDDNRIAPVANIKPPRDDIAVAEIKVEPPDNEKTKQLSLFNEQ